MEPTDDQPARQRGTFRPDSGDIPAGVLAAGGSACSYSGRPVAPSFCARRGSLPRSPPVAYTLAGSSRCAGRELTSPRVTSAASSTTSTPSRGRRCLPTSPGQDSTARPKRARASRLALSRAKLALFTSHRPGWRDQRSWLRLRRPEPLASDRLNDTSPFLTISWSPIGGSPSGPWGGRGKAWTASRASVVR